VGADKAVDPDKKKKMRWLSFRMFRSNENFEGLDDCEKSQVGESVLKWLQVRAREEICTQKDDCTRDTIEKKTPEERETCLGQMISKSRKTDLLAPLPLMGFPGSDKGATLYDPVELEKICDNAHSLATVYNNTAGAIQAYNAVLHQDDGHARALANLGVLYHREGDFQNARTFYLRALRAQPNRSKTTYNLGRLEHECGEHEAARSMYEAALIECEDRTACNALAYLGLLHQDIFGDLDAAQSCYARSLAIDPNHALTLDHCCALLVRRGKPDDARELHRLVCRIDASHM
jgi:Flp pilus assembly protein TadD